MLQELSSATQQQPAQRVQVEIERCRLGERVKIVVENHDDNLGWYTSGALCLPLQQLPILEQALEEMRVRARQPQQFADIIPFPTGEADLSA